MRERELMGACQAGVGALTQAMQAQKLLSDIGILCQVVKTEPTEKKGCAYAIRYPCAQERYVREALRKANIRMRGR